MLQNIATADTEKFDSDKWEQLKQYLADRDEDFDNKIYYVCQHCRPLLNDNKLPATCVLNGLYVEEIPVTTKCFREATCTAG